MEQEPYGKVWALRAGDVHQPLRMPGQVAEQFDTGANGATERSYNNFRWYRPGWGRYSQADPIGLAGGFNTFAYAKNGPTRLSDRKGETVGCYTQGQWNYTCGPEDGLYWSSVYQGVTNRLFPQYIQANGSFFVLAIAAQVDRCGCFYAGAGPNIGKAFLESEWSASLVFGWPDRVGPQGYVPHPPVYGATTVNIGGGAGLGINRSQDLKGGPSSWEAGLMSPQAGVSYVPMWRLYCPPAYR